MNKKFVLVSSTSAGRYIIENSFLKKENFELAGIIKINLKDGIFRSNFDSFYDLIKKHKIKIHHSSNINSKKTISWLKKINPNLIIQTGWSQKFGYEVLKLPKFGCIGMHPSPLPKGRGGATMNWVIIKGISKWGLTFIKMNEKYDAGSILFQKKFFVNNFDDINTVNHKINTISSNIFSLNINNWINGKFKLKKQQLKNITYFPSRKPSDGEFNFDFDKKKIHNMIKALTHPYPGAFFYFNKKKIFVWKSNIEIRKNKKIKNFLKNKKKQFLKIKPSLFVKVGKRRDEVIEFLRIQKNGQPEIWGHEF